MSTKDLMMCLTFTGLLAALAGCGKPEQTAAPPPEADRAVAKEKAEPVKVPTPAPLSNSVAATALTTITNSPQSSVASVVIKPVEIPAPASSLAPAKAPEPVVSVGAKSPAPVTLPPAGLAALSQDQMVQGLEQALAKGLEQAIARLGHDGGFLTNLNVKIPLPEKMQKVETALRAMKQEKLADDFVATMNHAAEQAVPQAGSVFADALKHLTIDDARAILSGPNDAATQYFQRTTSTNLYAKFYPIVQKATAQTGVTAAYKKVIEKADITQSLGGLGSTLGNSLLDKDSLDVDAYVTNKALDGLFKMVAEEEKQIRQNPVARTTDLLQKVFGSLKK